MELCQDETRLLAGASLSLACVAGLRASSNNDPLKVDVRKLISSTNFDFAALEQSLENLETGRHCGEVLASATLAEVQELAGVFIAVLFQDPALVPLQAAAEQNFVCLCPARI